MKESVGFRIEHLEIVKDPQTLGSILRGKISVAPRNKEEKFRMMLFASDKENCFLSVPCDEKLIIEIVDFRVHVREEIEHYISQIYNCVAELINFEEALLSAISKQKTWSPAGVLLYRWS